MESKRRNLATEERDYAYIAIDFDNTLVSDLYPEIGLTLNAESVLQELVEKGHKLILWTIRSGKYLEDAVNWCKKKGIELYGVNENPDFLHDEKARKVFFDLLIDDKSIGIPIAAFYDAPRSRIQRVVDWSLLREELKKLNLL